MADKLFFKVISCDTVYLIAVDFAVAVNYAVFTGKEYVFSGYMVFIALTAVGSQLAAEVFIRSVDKKLVGPVSVISEAVVKVVIQNGSACAEGNLSLKIGEKVNAVVVMMLDYFHIGVQYHPVDKICHLAHSAADA